MIVILLWPRLVNEYYGTVNYDLLLLRTRIDTLFHFRFCYYSKSCVAKIA